MDRDDSVIFKETYGSESECVSAVMSFLAEVRWLTLPQIIVTP